MCKRGQQEAMLLIDEQAYIGREDWISENLGASHAGDTKMLSILQCHARFAQHVILDAHM